MSERVGCATEFQNSARNAHSISNANAFFNHAMRATLSFEQAFETAEKK